MLDEHPLLCILFSTAIILGMIFGVVYVLDSAEEREMAEMHCVATGESVTRTEIIPITQIVGKVTVITPMPTDITRLEYKCDDGIRWR